MKIHGPLLKKKMKKYFKRTTTLHEAQCRALLSSGPYPRQQGSTKNLQRDGEPSQQKIETRKCSTGRAREGRGSEKSWKPMFRNKQPM